MGKHSRAVYASSRSSTGRRMQKQGHSLLAAVPGGGCGRAWAGLRLRNRAALASCAARLRSTDLTPAFASPAALRVAHGVSTGTQQHREVHHVCERPYARGYGQSHRLMTDFWVPRCSEAAGA